jgi:murein DD-endopeptidase MepM/ murein hydrolase activator NlpD
MPLMYLGLAAIAVDSFLVGLPRWPLRALLAVAFAIYLRLGTVRRPPVEVALPVAGPGMVRELLGPGRVLGNHVVLDLGGGVYAVLAHLRRGSVRVRPGDRVATGQQLAECGNSGNSSEPHLHFQLMDHPSVLLAAGLPLRFERYQVAGAARAGVPGNLQPFTGG